MIFLLPVLIGFYGTIATPPLPNTPILVLEESIDDDDTELTL